MTASARAPSACPWILRMIMVLPSSGHPARRRESGGGQVVRAREATRKARAWADADLRAGYLGHGQGPNQLVLPVGRCGPQ
jgi:hypothetical protein